MKKLVTLLSVLAVTSAASAVTIIEPWISSLNGQPIEPTKEITINESDVINFDIVYFPDGAMDLGSLDTIVSVDGMGTLDLSMLTWPGPPPPPGILEIVPGKEYQVSITFFAAMGQGILIDHALLHCDQGFPTNDVLVSLGPGGPLGTRYADGSAYDGAWGSILIHNVPEPATIVLFGVGGVLLLRKRRG
jgi:hypothetical protein